MKVYAKTAPETTCGKEEMAEMINSFHAEGMEDYEQKTAEEMECLSRNVLPFNPNASKEISDRTDRIVLDGAVNVTVTDGVYSSQRFDALVSDTAGGDLPDKTITDCYEWNADSWVTTCNLDPPFWSPCGCNICAKCDTTDVVCYRPDPNGGTMTERPCEE